MLVDLRKHRQPSTRTHVCCVWPIWLSSISSCIQVPSKPLRHQASPSSATNTLVFVFVRPSSPQAGTQADKQSRHVTTPAGLRLPAHSVSSRPARPINRACLCFPTLFCIPTLTCPSPLLDQPDQSPWDPCCLLPAVLIH